MQSAKAQEEVIGLNRLRDSSLGIAAGRAASENAWGHTGIRGDLKNLRKRISRSTIVNMRMVAAVVRDESGRGTMRLKNRPETLPVSLTFMPLFKNM